MSDYYYIEPVYVDPGRNGYNRDKNTELPQLEWWPGDDLVQWDKGFLITVTLRNRLEETNLSGYTISDITVETTQEFEREYPDTTLPEIYSLEITGEAYHDDFGIGYRYKEEKNQYFKSLIVSDCGLELLENADFDNAHYVERIDEKDVFPPGLGLEGAIKLFFEEPTKRNKSKVVARLLDRQDEIPFNSNSPTEKKILQLADVLTLELETEETVRLVEEYDGDPPEKEDAVEFFFEFFEERE